MNQSYICIFSFCFRLSMLIFGGLWICSCQDDMDRPSASARISFTPEVSDSWTPHTRSGMVDDTPCGSVITLQGGGSTTLYLHTLYTDSIASFSSDSRSDTAVLTRAAPVTLTDMYDSFGVSAYSYMGTWSESQATPNYIYDATAGKSGSDYLLSSTYYWPGASYKIKFFAYAPKGNNAYTLSGNTSVGSPTISVTVPSSVDGQKDLLVAQSGELSGGTNNAVPLNFNHALTAVKFVCGSDMQRGTVNKVSLKNVYSKGTYNMGTNGWSSQNTLATYSQELNKPTDGSVNSSLTTDAQTFMMVPQTLPDGAQIEVVFTDSTNTRHTLTADIKGSEWPMGKTVTYKISSSSINWTYILNINESIDFTYAGGTKTYDVSSYRQNAMGDKESVAWSAQYSIDDGISWTSTKPGWLTAFTASGIGGVSTPCNATVVAQTGVENNAHTDVLKKAPTKGSAASPYNLANRTGNAIVENTANCYVVDAPGVYSFPLVYGNAIKDGSTNASAYTSTATGSTILNPFINHAGKGITNPYISKNGCTPAKAELIWQDAPSLVTEIQYNNVGADGGNISFKVDKESIRQGNAVIAVKDAGNTILWSWHIWVTDENIYNTFEVTNFQNVNYKFMPVNLGWCEGPTTDYAERSCKVRFTAGNQEKEIIIKQVANSIPTIGNHPYYQWGRKDPFVPAIRDKNKTWYNAAGTASNASPGVSNHLAGSTCIRNYILKPDRMHSVLVGDNTYSNLWSANSSKVIVPANDDLVTKTIYDPCPVGFKLPATNAFTGFSPTGRTDTEMSYYTYNSDRVGWDMYRVPQKSGPHVFLPASGWRQPGGVFFNAYHSYRWTACCDNVPKGLNACIISLGGGTNEFRPINSSDRAIPLGVLPCQE